MTIRRWQGGHNVVKIRRDTEEETDTGFKWWMKFVIVPVLVALIGGGFIVKGRRASSRTGGSSHGVGARGR